MGLYSLSLTFPEFIGDKIKYECAHCYFVTRGTAILLLGNHVQAQSINLQDFSPRGATDVIHQKICDATSFSY
jgi:hypothetical protein